MTVDRLFRARRAVVGDVEGPAAIAVTAGRIVAVGQLDEPIDAAEVIELGPDEVLLPGLVDTHVHVNEPGRTEWEGFDTATRAAAAGGVTTIVDMPLNSIPPTTSRPALEVKRDRARDQAHVDVGFWGGAIPGNLGELGPLHEAGVFGFKCFLVDSGVAEFPPLDRPGFDAAMAETARSGALLIVHAEDASVISQAPPAQGSQYDQFLRSRPGAAETRAVAQVLDAAARTGGRVHILHVSSADVFPRLRAARDTGVDVTAETCPHYLTLDAAHIPDGATQFKCCPPIRDRANQERLWAGLVDGDLDMVVSDHSPCPAELKRLDTGDFGQAWGGVASVQLGLSVMWTAARARGHSLVDVALWMGRRPADRVGLAGKGRIQVGADADLVVFAPDEEFVVDPRRLWHRHPVSAYTGRCLTGVVRQTWLRGARIEPDGEPRGRLLSRGER
jgi:allantoinase